MATPSARFAGSRPFASISKFRGSERLAVNGRLSTHVLDTHSGKPAAGIAITLIELCALGENRVIARAVTNATAAPTSR